MALFYAAAITAAIFAPAAVAARTVPAVGPEAEISSTAIGFTLRTELNMLDDLSAQYAVPSSADLCLSLIHI